MFERAAELNSKTLFETWSSAITGLAVFLTAASVGALVVFGHRALWELGGIMAMVLTGKSEHAIMRVVEDHTHMDGAAWLLLMVGTASLGVAVWIMESIAQRLGPPYRD